MPVPMKYVAMSGPGGPEVMQIATGQAPVPEADEVLIRVMAAGVNRPDIAQRMGVYPPPAGASVILGLEVAGEVVAIGAAVHAWAVGDKVCALTNGGGYAEYCVAPASQCLPWPKGFTALQAAALPETYFTVWANLFTHGAFANNESVLIHGGTSGIGVTAIQLARAFSGGAIYVTAGSALKCQTCIELGATAAINYREEDFGERIKELTDGKGVDVILDIVGAPYFQRNVDSLAMDGRLVEVSTMHGAKAEYVDLRKIMAKRLIITGSMMRPRSTMEKAVIADELRENVWPMLDLGHATPVIYREFPLSAVADAHRLLESSEHIGKIMLKVE